MPFDSTRPEYYPLSNFRLADTKGMAIPSGTTNQRDETAINRNGTVRYNSTLNVIEAFVNSAWASVRTAGEATITRRREYECSGTSPAWATIQIVSSNGC